MTTLSAQTTEDVPAAHAFLIVTTGRPLAAASISVGRDSSLKVGENVACASSGTLPATPEGVVAPWMDSTSPREVILTAAFRDAGIGVATSRSGARYCTLDMGCRVP